MKIDVLAASLNQEVNRTKYISAPSVWLTHPEDPSTVSRHTILSVRERQMLRVGEKKCTNIDISVEPARNIIYPGECAVLVCIFDTISHYLNELLHVELCHWLELNLDSHTLKGRLSLSISAIIRSYVPLISLRFFASYGNIILILVLYWIGCLFFN